MASKNMQNKSSEMIPRIGAIALMYYGDYTYKGNWVYHRKSYYKKRCPMFVVIAKECLYLYKNCNSKEQSYAFALKDFSSVETSESNAQYCITLTTGTGDGESQTFDCLTEKDRTKCVKLISSLIKPQMNSSADSGVDVGGTIEKDNNDQYQYAERGEPVWNRLESGKPEEKASNQTVKQAKHRFTIPQNMQSTKVYRNGTVVENTTAVVSTAKGPKDQHFQRTAETMEDETCSKQMSGKRSNIQMHHSDYANWTVTQDDINSKNGGNTVAKTAMTPDAARDQTKLKKIVTSAATNQANFGKHEKDDDSSNSSSDKDSYEDSEPVYENVQFNEKRHSFYMEGNDYSANKAISDLENEPIGTFLIRKGKENYVLSVQADKGKLGVIKYKIQDMPRGFTLDHKAYFPTLEELVQFYGVHKLYGRGRDIFLKRGFKARDGANKSD